MSVGRRARGFTLLELMTVVAIVGVASAFAGIALTGVSKVSRANGGATAVARVLSTTRMRAITERCPFFVQINGPTWDPATAPADVLRLPSQALVYRKGNCESTVAWYESGATLAERDKLVDQIILSEFMAVYNASPAGLVTGGPVANRLGPGSVTIYFNSVGQRSVSLDNDFDGISVDSGLGAADFTIEVQATPGNADDPRRSVVIPQAGSARTP